eukprot:gb/GECG01005087.1/.p1 GENE.gb/GECG01005087.1/~~gb/GECG01005087.1/.p1  ORF type:complete len:355 (+),score=51.69 gb/GECG01005087.1/:1-1065(+)
MRFSEGSKSGSASAATSYLVTKTDQPADNKEGEKEWCDPSSDGTLTQDIAEQSTPTDSSTGIKMGSRYGEWKDSSEPHETNSTSTSKSTQNDVEEDDYMPEHTNQGLDARQSESGNDKNEVSGAQTEGTTPTDEPNGLRDLYDETPSNGVAAASSSVAEATQDCRLNRLEDAGSTIIEAIGEDSERDGLLKTPHRFAKSMMALTSGYRMSAENIIKSALFDVDSDDLVVVRDIDFHSLCEHHMLPFYGKVHIGYIPQGKVVGLSKLARVVEVFSRRLQVQERLTQEIAEALYHYTDALGVAVFVSASHMCMSMRGVEQPDSKTSTTCFKGCFKGQAESSRAHRNDFFDHLRNSN